MQIQDLRTTIEVRERFERRIDRDFNSDFSDSRSDLFTRVRAGTKFQVGNEWAGEFRWQYAHVWSWTPADDFTTWNSDADLAYLQKKCKDWTVTAGRQKINLGSQRLVGSAEWINTSRALDGIRAQNPRLDLWFAEVGVGNPKPRNLTLAGATYKGTWGQTTLLQKWDETATGDIDITTLSHWFNRELSGVTLDFEGAIQCGQSQRKDQEGFALHGRLTRSVSAGTTGFIEANLASGGQDGDGSNTFDQVFGTNHGKYGLMDMQGWKNMRHWAVGLEHKTRSGIQLKVAWHNFELEDSKDAWYGAGGSPNKHALGNFIDPTGAAGKDVGSELDFEATWNPRPNLTASVGIGTFKPGRFVRTLAGSDDSQVWGFAQIQSKF